MTDKEAVEEIKSLLLSLGGQEYLKEEEPENYKLSKAIETVLNLIQIQQEEIEKKNGIVRSIISRLDNDIKNITEIKAKKSEHYLDDYTRCRLKAYKTKTREIKEYIEKEYFINKVEKENKDE